MLTLPVFEWVRPTSVDEVLRELAEHPGECLIVAGGTDAVPNLKHRLHEPRRVVSLEAVTELREAREDADGLKIGARLTLSELERLPAVTRDFPAVARAASLVASPQIRNMGTLGGNLCLDTRCTYYNQTYFWREALGFCLKKSGTVCHVVPQGKRCVAAHSSDVAPALIAYGAEVEIAGPGGRRWLALDQFFVGDGIHNNVLTANEMVTAVRLPAASRGQRGAYRKLRPRGAIDFPMLSVAVTARGDARLIQSARIVVSALGAKPRLLGSLDPLVAGRPADETTFAAVAASAHKQCRPLTNVPYDDDWRHAMVPVLVTRTLRDAFEEGPPMKNDDRDRESEHRERYANDVWEVLARWRAEGRRFVLLTVVEARGFTPQKPGGRMLLSDEGETAGTVGGGAIEHACLADARAMLAEGGSTRMVRRQLTTELGMCCGGEMVVHLEVLEARPRLVVFGAGHVARPLAALAHDCGFAVTVVDARAEWLTPERYPHATRVARDPDAAAREGDWNAADYAVVTTHDHALDQRVVQELLPRGLRFTGLIGSLAKQRKFALRLRARGFDEDQVARLRTPVGLSIGARTPEEIAVSIVAELVSVRRGATPERGWLPPERTVARLRSEAALDAAATAVASRHGSASSRGRA